MHQEEEREWLVVESQGQRVFGMLHKPLGEGPFPAVLLCHGFTADKVGRKRQYVQVAEGLARSGVMALRFDYRGCGDSDGSETEMMLTGNIADAMAAMQHLRERDDVDQERLGLLGRSMGGPISIQVAHQHPDVKALALWSPVSDSPHWRRQWTYFTLLPALSDTVWLHDVPYNRPFIKRYFQEYFDLAPTRVMPDLGHIPVLHVHGEKDMIVTQEHLEEYQKYRATADASTEWLSLPGSDHSFFHPKEQQQLVDKTVAWFCSTLLENTDESARPRTPELST